MTSDAANISAIETFLESKLKGVVSDNVYAGTLPSTLPTDKKDFVVIDCASALHDFSAYAKGIVNIFMYAMPSAMGTKNVPQLSQMEQKYNKFLAETDDEIYAITESYRYTDYDSNYGMHYIISAINLIVK